MKASVKLAVLAVTASLLSQAVSADLLLYDGFDYASGPLAGMAGGQGSWKGAWNGELKVAADSLTLPNMPFATVGGHIVSAAGGGNSNRNFAAIDVSKPGTYYMSYLVQRNGFDPGKDSGQWADCNLRSGDFTRVLRGTVTSSQTLGISMQNGTTKLGGDANTTDTFFFVIKIVLNDGSPDQMFASVYRNGADIPRGEPAAWDFKIMDADVVAELSKVTFWAGGADGFSAGFDEFRLATTYAEAVPIPAEASAADPTGN